MNKIYDVIIIGGGPTGLNCAIECVKAALNYVVLEKGALVNSIYNFPTDMTFFSTSKKLEIANVPFISHRDKPTRREALEYYRRLWEHFNLNVKFSHEVREMTKTIDGKEYVISTSQGNFNARKVIVATGFYDTPRKLNAKGHTLPKVSHYYKDAHQFAGRELLIIGAANSASDVALEALYVDSKVTMAIRDKEVYPKVKYWIRPNLINRIAEGSINAYFETEAIEIKPKSVILRNKNGIFEIENDYVLAMIGYKPNYQLLAKLGIEIDNDMNSIPKHNKESLMTTLDGVYIAGVLVAGLATSKLFIENTRHHAKLIIEDIKKHMKLNSIKAAI